MTERTKPTADASATCAWRSAGSDLLDVDELDVDRAEIVGLVGESGAGKSLMQSAILGLLPGSGRGQRQHRLRRRGARSAPAAARDARHPRPAHRGRAAGRAGGTDADAAGRDLDRPGPGARTTCPRPSGRPASSTPSTPSAWSPALLQRYPHQLSGGEAQRVSIALAVALRAELVLADEATSALDVTVQAEVAELFRELRISEGTSFLLVSHDLALVAGSGRPHQHHRARPHRGARRAGDPRAPEPTR